jgi:shikimate 5-dehydrogenase
VVGAHWIGTVDWAHALASALSGSNTDFRSFMKDLGRTARWRKLEAGVSVCAGMGGTARKSLQAQSAVTECF